MPTDTQAQMRPEAEAVWEQYQRILNETFKWADGLSDDQLNWRPQGVDTNTIGNLISHILGLGLFAVTERIGGQSTARDRNAEFKARVTREMLNQRRADAERRIHETLSKLTSADMERVVSSPGGRGETSVLNLLLYTLSHLSQHMGQVIVTRKLLDGQR